MEMYEGYLISMYIMGDEGRVLWGNQDYDFLYPSLAPQNSTETEWSDSADPLTYARALFGFVIAMVLYFCVLCYFCDRNRSASRREVDRSIITKRVLPHGQSQLFLSAKDDERSKNESCSRWWMSLCCSKQSKKEEVAPSAESAVEVLETYNRSKSCSDRLCAQCNARIKGDTNNESKDNLTDTEDDEDELVLAEEGLSSIDNDILCPICIEPFHVGEKVAWSRIGYCRHAFHYECILPWLMLGNAECPVCRDTFWTKDGMSSCWGCHVSIGSERNDSSGQSRSEMMRQSGFCVQHGLVSPPRSINAEDS